MLDPDTTFRAANPAALLGWLALLLLPASVRWARPAWRFSGRLLPLAFVLLRALIRPASLRWRAEGAPA